MSDYNTSSPLLDAAMQHLSDARPLVPMYIHLILSALFPIYTGAHASLSRPSSAAKPDKKDKQSIDEADEDDEDDTVQQMEGLSPQDAIIFPVTAAIVLAGLYFLIKRYGAELINRILGWYFAGVGIYSVAKLVNDGLGLLCSCLFPTYYGQGGRLWKIDDKKRKAYRNDNGGDVSDAKDIASLPLGFLPLSAVVTKSLWRARAAVKQKYITKIFVHSVVDFRANLTIINFMAAVVSVAVVGFANLVSKPWYLTNLQGFAVCYSALQFMSPTTFATGSLILGGLFCYDIWAVFFTPLMVTVAKNLDQPIKLVFPRPDEPSEIPGEAAKKSYSMLGLGDIVLPGLMIGLALRFDLYMFYFKKMRRTSKPSEKDGDEDEVVQKVPYVSVTGHPGDRFWTRSLPASIRPAHLQTAFTKTYFFASMIGYVAGLIATLGVMSVFHHAQPALLYLVPGVLICLWGTGLARGEIKEIWEFSEAITGEQLDEDDGQKDKPGEPEEDIKSWLLGLWRRLSGSAEVKKTGEDQKTDDEDAKDSSIDDERAATKKITDGDVLLSISVRRQHHREASTGKDDTDAHDDVAAETPSDEDSRKTTLPSDTGSEEVVRRRVRPTYES